MTPQERQLIETIALETADRLQNDPPTTAEGWLDLAEEVDRVRAIAAKESDRLAEAEDR